MSKARPPPADYPAPGADITGSSEGQGWRGWAEGLELTLIFPLPRPEGKGIQRRQQPRGRRGCAPSPPCLGPEALGSEPAGKEGPAGPGSAACLHLWLNPPTRPRTSGKQRRFRPWVPRLVGGPRQRQGFREMSGQGNKLGEGCDR